MQNTAWIALLRLIPPELQDTLMVTTSNGMSLNVQSLIRMEKDYVVFRGRVAASTEAGRVFFVPYDQIMFLNFANAMREEEVMAMYANAPAASVSARPALAIPKPGARAAAQEEAEPETEPAPAAPTPGAPPPIAAQGAPSPAGAAAAASGRTAILDRLRARVASSAKPGDK